MTETKNSVEYLTIITSRNYKDKILKLLLELKCHLIKVVYAKGSVKSGYFKDMLGLVPEEKKVMISCIVTSDIAGKLLEQLVTKFHFNQPNTGIAFTIPVDKLSV
jgi:nitrogen regulatory protein PII